MGGLTGPLIGKLESTLRTIGLSSPLQSVPSLPSMDVQELPGTIEKRKRVTNIEADNFFKLTTLGMEMSPKH